MKWFTPELFILLLFLLSIERGNSLSSKVLLSFFFQSFARIIERISYLPSLERISRKKFSEGKSFRFPSRLKISSRYFSFVSRGRRRRVQRKRGGEASRLNYPSCRRRRTSLVTINLSIVVFVSFFKPLFNHPVICKYNIENRRGDQL